MVSLTYTSTKSVRKGQTVMGRKQGNQIGAEIELGQAPWDIKAGETLVVENGKLKKK